MTDGYGYMGQSDGTSEFDRHAFHRERDLATIRGGHPVKVMAVYKSDGTSKKTQGAIEPAGFVDVQPLISQVDGNGTKQDHGTIYHVPYLRHKGGNAAFIMDPVVNDIGVIVVMDRDISSLKNAIAGSGQSSQTFTPNSRRRHDFADAIYIGGFLSGTPKQYTTYTAAGGVQHGDLAGSTHLLDGQGQVFSNAVTNNSVNAKKVANLIGGTTAFVQGGQTATVTAGNSISITAPNVGFSNGVGGSPTFTGLPPGISSINIVEFTSSGTYTPSAGLAYAHVTCMGGGGGGGGLLNPGTGVGGTGAQTLGSGGGGQGGLCWGWFMASTIGGSQSVGVGGGGSPGTGAQNGNPGGTSFFGGLIAAGGGGGGGWQNWATSGDYGNGGSGGTVSGSFSGFMVGQHGGRGTSFPSGITNACGGDGGGSQQNGAYSGGSPNAGGGGGLAGDGGGGSASTTAGSGTGGSGVGGYVIITEFIA